ncbi:hypothetical protein [Coralloluteibacterium stylophorae]|uniref:Uncharacterized protein n=1 Tax=Coralloluteibacterium stylophorae TaxID=1776034 RepID=A0A8J7VR00_9GAMM|nr:hypothetical protein [Coralloluteibacterium stylophorae]MBS7457688.1 hypothetical protein [Coralloluteibacterium stylophorae]
MTRIPYHAEDLIAELDRQYPEVIYDPLEPREEFLLKSGERRLVVQLKHRLRHDREDAEDNYRSLHVQDQEAEGEGY